MQIPKSESKKFSILCTFNVSFYSVSLLFQYTLFCTVTSTWQNPCFCRTYLKAFIPENKDFKESHALMSPLLNLLYLSANKGNMLTATHREKKNSEREKEYSSLPQFANGGRSLSKDDIIRWASLKIFILRYSNFET